MSRIAGVVAEEFADDEDTPETAETEKEDEAEPTKKRQRT